MLAGPHPSWKLARDVADCPRYDAGLLASGWTASSWRVNCLSSA
jgi:hypothetical protein